MDPQATLRLISEWDSYREAIPQWRDLADWLRRGGEQPRWESAPTGAGRFRVFLRSAGTATTTQEDQ